MTTVLRESGNAESVGLNPAHVDDIDVILRALSLTFWCKPCIRAATIGQTFVPARSQKKQASWSPMAHVRRIDLIFDAEREINGLAADKCLELRRAHIVPLVAELEGWMRAERARLSRHNDVAKAMDYMLTRWTAFTASSKTAGFA